jgi:hypothetical protein
MLVPPQSLHLFLRRLSSQMLAPPQSLQVLLWRLCWQMLAPTQSLHSLLRQLCSQMLAPPLSLHLFLWRLHLFLWRSPLRCAHPLPLPPLGAAEGGHAADGLAAHGAGEGAVEQRGTAGGGRHQPARDLKRYAWHSVFWLVHLRF